MEGGVSLIKHHLCDHTKRTRKGYYDPSYLWKIVGVEIYLLYYTTYLYYIIDYVFVVV